MNILRACMALCVLTLLLPSPQCETITFGSLVDEMTDMHRLAKFPEPVYKTVQFSSYDRRSKTPGGPDWYANSDGFGSEPIPNFEEVLKEPGADNIGEYLVCDVKGPGAIVRTWTAAIKGDVRVYLDGSKDAVYEGSAQQFFQYTAQHFLADSGIDSKLIDRTFQQRNACYFPIPFARRCRIEWRGNLKELHFYEVQIRLYEPHAEVATFEPSDVKVFQEKIESVAKILGDIDGEWQYKSEKEALPLNAMLKAGETVSSIKHKGSGAIERLTLQLKADDLNAALRQTVMKISFDGFQTEQIISPVGDFFGAAPGVNPYTSLPFTVTPEGEMTCRYVMPFRESVNITFENRGEQTVEIIGSVLPCAFEVEPERFQHFRARWRVEHDLISKPERDLPFLLANGKGVYVGTTSYLWNPNLIPTPYGNWWGEGDEKIFVDEDEFPTTFGTGSEDYYNYAWSAPDIFLFPYCGQPLNDGPGNRGFVTNFRWHVIDALPFNEQIAFYMELFTHQLTPKLTYARISYHYGSPGIYDDVSRISMDDLRKPVRDQVWSPVAEFGAQNSTFYETEAVATKSATSRMDNDNLFSNGSCWVWQPKAIGETVELKLSLQEAGKYGLRMTCAHTENSGTFSILFNGEDIDEIVELNVAHRKYLRNRFLPEFELKAGEQTLVLKYEGAPDGAAGEIGVDFVWLQKR
ncbi:MAG: DUF2961 domain-containing protein [Candidatus Hinthialibacter antarcticus]|nr:DUF2961 domain-containing protein [Candidatus Hinthialibacter antarcticus]